tara:strand:- start:455 stop:604 length:150 start_codon:yes stop_codon:yes gene_type:complete
MKLYGKIIIGFVTFLIIVFVLVFAVILPAIDAANTATDIIKDREKASTT